MLKIICLQGGSGSMVGKCITHLAATGKIKSGDRIIIQLFDQDSSNKDTESTKKLLESSATLSDFEKLKSNTDFGGQLTEEKYFFNTPIELRTYKIPEAFKRVCEELGIPANKDLSLKECFDLSGDATGIDSLLMDTLFTKAQQQLKTADGFEGDAARGALMYSFLLNHDKEIFKPVQDCVSANNHCQVIICGSIFGGTGASFFKMTGEALRKISPKLVHIAGVLIFPTFTFIKPDKDKKGNEFPINPNYFWRKTLTSLRGYSEVPNLVKKGPEDGAGIFDRIYIAAQPNNEMHNCTKSVDGGGQDQERASDFVDLVAAYYVADFLNSEFDPGTMSFAKTNGNNLTNIYTLVYPEVSNDKKLMLDCFNDENDTAKRFAAMLSFCAFVGILKHDVDHCNNEPDNVNSINKMIDFPRIIKKSQRRTDTINAFNNVVSDTLIDYLFSFVECVKELSENGRTYQDGNVDYSDRYYLFYKKEVSELYQFMEKVKTGVEANANMISRIHAIDSFCPNVTGCSAASVFNNALIPRFDKVNDSSKLEDLFKAYLNHCYKYITENTN